MPNLVPEGQSCLQACLDCGTARLSEDRVQMMVECIRTDRDCANTCSLCATSCAICAEECECHKHDHCQRCAAACRKYAEAEA